MINWNHIFWCKFFVLFFLFLFCFIFLFLIPGRRQLPKLWKFPGIVLRCRLHPSPPSKKCICKQTFDCCCECNHAFYTCISMAGYTYRACMHGAYKCMCDCIYIEQKSYSELPYKLQHYPILINPPPLHPLRNPEYWYSSLQPGSMWNRPFEL